MSFVDTSCAPESVHVFRQRVLRPMSSNDRERWEVDGCWVETHPEYGRLKISVGSPGGETAWVLLRWRGDLPRGVLLLGDHWERGYGDLEWRGMVPERPMPWYFLLCDGEATHGYGVMTNAASMCFWTADASGISLWLDLRCGGLPVRPGLRTIEAATVIAREGRKSESPFAAANALCRTLCRKSRLTPLPTYGGNNWYYAYGKSSHEQILVDATLISRLAADENRPFMVIDSGWEPRDGQRGGELETNDRFPNMPRLADQISDVGAQPGIWIRPLLTRGEEPRTWRLPTGRFTATEVPVLDPTVPEAAERITLHIRTLVEWGYRLIKHDFTTYDLLARWGFEMGVRVTADGWAFTDRSRTTAEVISDLYRVMREAAGEETLLLGCNTVGHLAAGLFEVQRTGDDTSGRKWERTRKMGVNSLAFRMPQQGAFFDCDADCVGLTERVPWPLNRQWLDVLSRSGTSLFVSADPDVVGSAQETDLKMAFARAARRQAPAEPVDWMETTCPRIWRFGEETAEYDWLIAETGVDALSD